MDNVALIYATSLFELASETNDIETFEKDLTLVKEVLMSDDSIMNFLNHYKITKEAKIQVIDQSFKDQVSLYVLNFIKLLIVKKRINELLNIIEAYHQLTNDYLEIKEGVIYATYSLKQEEISRIEQAMSEKLNVKVKLTCKVDESLIGGLKVVVGNHIEDGSIKNRMNLLKQELLRK